MEDETRTALARYIAHESGSVQGWFARVDAEIYRAILLGQSEQNLSGSAIEIGIHHGRSFVALCLALRSDEKAYCIDIFDDQNLNKDSSGKGDRSIFESNLARFGIDREKVVIDPRSSQHVKPAEIVDAVGPARLFSIDGGHWEDVVRSDLRLAESSLARHGVIALDDFLRSEWPNVSAGYFAWYAARATPLVPFAIGANKLYLCQEQWASFYRGLLAKDPFLGLFLARHVDFQGFTIPVYQQYISPEMQFRARLFAYFRVFNPELYARIKRIVRSMPRTKPD